MGGFLGPPAPRISIFLWTPRPLYFNFAFLPPRPYTFKWNSPYPVWFTVSWQATKKCDVKDTSYR